MVVHWIQQCLEVHNPQFKIHSGSKYGKCKQEGMAGISIQSINL